MSDEGLEDFAAVRRIIEDKLHQEFYSTQTKDLPPRMQPRQLPNLQDGGTARTGCPMAQSPQASNRVRPCPSAEVLNLQAKAANLVVRAQLYRKRPSALADNQLPVSVLPLSLLVLGGSRIRKSPVLGWRRRRASGLARASIGLRRDISKSFLAEEPDWDGEGFVDSRPIALDSTEKWYAREPDSKAADGGEDQEQQGVPVLGVLRAARFAPHAKINGGVKAMHPEFADIALAVLQRGNDVSDKALATQTLKREIGSEEVFTMLRTDARALRRTFARRTASPQEESADEEVAAFLERSWRRLLAARASRRRARSVYRMATLFGGLLAQVPDPALCEAFESVLMQWAEPDSLPVAASQPAWAKAQARNTARQATRRLAQQLESSRRGPLAKPLASSVVAETLATIAAADAQVLEESFTVFSESLTHLDRADVASTSLWFYMAKAPPCARVWLLDAMISDQSGSVSRRALEDSGVSTQSALRACTDFAAEDLHEEEEEEAPAQKLNKRPRAKTSKISGKPVLPRLVPQREESDKPRTLTWDYETTVLKAGHIIEHLAAIGGLARLSDMDATLLYRCLGTRLGMAAPTVVRPLLARAPAAFTEKDLVPFAMGLPSTVAAQLWTSLAFAFVDRWSQLQSDELLQLMCSLPTDLMSAPVELLEALTAECEVRPGVLALGSNQLLTLTQAWASRPLPFSLRRLLVEAVQENLLAIDARHLVLASRIIEEGASSDREQADGERPEQANTMPSGPLLWWTLWMEHASAERRLVGWGRCGEALREVQEWYKAAGSSKLAEQVLLQVVVKQLIPHLHEAPLEVLFSLHSAVQGSELQEQVSPSLDVQMRHVLQEEMSQVSISTAVSVANGETPVQCTPDSVLWSALVVAIAGRLRSQRDIDFFCRCHPNRALWKAVLEKAEDGWTRLELQLHSSVLFQPETAEAADPSD